MMQAILPGRMAGGQEEARRLVEGSGPGVCPTAPALRGLSPGLNGSEGVNVLWV